MSIAIATLLAAIFAGVFGVIGTGANAGLTSSTNQTNADLAKETNETNLAINDATNKANLEIAEKTNQANAEQAELAYQRSLPAVQVQNLMAAGMSQTAAIQSLTGGGSYSAPIMQSAQMTPAHVDAFRNIAPQIDLSALAESIGGLPSNSLQSELQDQQIKNLVQTGDNMRKEEIRKQEEHEARMDDMRYNRWERDKIDEFMSLIENRAIEKGVNLDELTSYNDMIKRLDLSNDPIIRDLPASARDRAFERAQRNINEKRAERDANNRNRAADDTHEISMQNLQDLKDAALDFKNAQSAKDKEYKAREARALLSLILSQYDLNIEEFKNSIRYNSDGTLYIAEKRSKRAEWFWQKVSDTIGIGVIKDLLSAISIAK